ncbi:hypothetical protein K438DRAFT_1976458 [Mycena galopus ATCC 62051]|nr:hypothetical protein K438DRAFT_1976458 [Mycena galopus ATCC 62051]
MRLTECNEYCAATAALSQARAASARCASSISRGVRLGDHTPTAKAASPFTAPHAPRPRSSRVAAPPSARGRVSLPVALLAHAHTNSTQRQIAHASRGLGPHDAVVSAASPPQPALHTLPLHPHPPNLMPLASALLLPVLLSATPFCLTLPTPPSPIPPLPSLIPHSSK